MSSYLQNSVKIDLTFADVFAGCGGLSLGLINAGWQGLFAIEKNTDAFETLKTNLISSQRGGFVWPSWFPVMPTEVVSFLTDYGDQVSQLKGQLTLLAGGPPCQGFSMAGRRTHADPRNTLTEEYIKIVQKLEPRFLLIENVQGFTLPFKKHRKGSEKDKQNPYSSQIIDQLKLLGYGVFSKIIDLSNYGVPQTRKRFILIAIRKDDPAFTKLGSETPFSLLEANRASILASKGLDFDIAISVKEAIGDLEVSEKELANCTDSPVKGFKQITYNSDSFSSPFIVLMRKGFNDAPNSLRLSNHSLSTIQKFQRIMETCSSGRPISKEDRKRLGIKKRAITPLNSNLPSTTVTTLPDDIIHYSEPRILTVRENARLQTFPDWYSFTGNYTTGGNKRKSECPRYTQVGNAVPPLLAEAIGLTLKELAS
ncbi:MAG: DNA (cytosine-5-)-methyltransferase [Chloroflexi bacterium AL-W]|nr:DNA (cytosine-5-)-methyltransferase [Chloroflexi bacterium AL-N1]NOK64573.1 DNA (cytosine-5-)-methyltransferase [Chloroflexi bacterium AL-N10]NOK75815.1 DNA (cytosine-5-)-methyltransferase [Chloroflexi bacterium AL-N5]NOK80426.1 DNA (cytosine-5-)-methyltransferase [Chloroflexi bacterium AL-W]NOK86940.1 DNA (cytosine-5-)-methyltransferase [Chloroflexi bacterium AL-N15]